MTPGACRARIADCEALERSLCGSGRAPSSQGGKGTRQATGQRRGSGKRAAGRREAPAEMPRRAHAPVTLRQPLQPRTGPGALIQSNLGSTGAYTAPWSGGLTVQTTSRSSCAAAAASRGRRHRCRREHRPQLRAQAALDRMPCQRVAAARAAVQHRARHREELPVVDATGAGGGGGTAFVTITQQFAACSLDLNALSCRVGSSTHVQAN